ncbi:hypothetical protein D3C86_2222420 [compost metagenome]
MGPCMPPPRHSSTLRVSLGSVTLSIMARQMLPSPNRLKFLSLEGNAMWVCS